MQPNKFVASLHSELALILIKKKKFNSSIRS